MATPTIDHGSRFNEHARAFWLPIVGVVAVLALVWWGPDNDRVTSVAITAIVTLTAGAAGHASGAASRRQ